MKACGVTKVYHARSCQVIYEWTSYYCCKLALVTCYDGVEG
jgi:hypothetical protein